LIGLGALSTNPLASLRPRPVSSFTSLTTASLAPPGAFKITSNSVFSSVASPPPAPPRAATATAAAAGSIPYSSKCVLFYYPSFSDNVLRIPDNLLPLPLSAEITFLAGD